MRRLAPLLPLLLLAACSTAAIDPPSLAPRAAEAIDPRLPIDPDPPIGTLDPALAARLAAAVASARSGVDEFARLATNAEALAAEAGPVQSESWIAAQQALSALVAQHGVTTRALADIDEFAAERIDEKRWLVPANRIAIEAAAAEVGSIYRAQVTNIERIGARLRG